MEPARLTRRAALALLALGGGAVALRSLLERRPYAELLDGVEVRPSDGSRYSEPLLASVYATRMSPEFGRLYLEQRPGAAPDAGTLAAEVMARLEAVRPWRGQDLDLGGMALEGRLAEAIAADFLAERGLCEIDGWYLAQTECRLAAMRYMAAPPSG